MLKQDAKFRRGHGARSDLRVCALGDAVLLVEEVCYAEDERHRPVPAQVIQRVQQRHVRAADLRVRDLRVERHHREENAVGRHLMQVVCANPNHVVQVRIFAVVLAERRRPVDERSEYDTHENPEKEVGIG